MTFTDTSLRDALQAVQPPSERARQDAWAHLNALVKPPESLGRLEQYAAQLAAIYGTADYAIDRRCVLVMAADNGVVAEGVASAPQSVTAMQTVNFTRGLTGVSVLARQFGADVLPVDIGVNADLRREGILERKIRYGTANLMRESAMLRSEALAAIGVGIDCVRAAVRDGYRLIGVGEMGIGNTTTSSAVLAALLRLPEEEIASVVGRGAGLLEEDYLHKVDVIRTALALHTPDAEDPVDVLTKVGGLDIAGMAGAFLGSAICGIPAVVDGFISIVAALCAVRICPAARGYLIPSHKSFERGYALAAEALELSPPLLLEMRLGEGSGCPLMFALLDAATAVLRNMGTFEQAQIGEGYLEKIQGKDAF